MQDHIRYIDIVKNAAGEQRYLVLARTFGRLMETGAPYTVTELPVILQTAVTLDEATEDTANSHCLLYGLNTTDFATSGDTIEVKITTTSPAPKFKWRKNAEAWSAEIDVGRNITIGVNGLIVDFLTTSGVWDTFNSWTWERTTFPSYPTLPEALNDLSLRTYNPRIDPYNLDIYISLYGETILRLRNDILSSVGYKRVYGKYVAVFYNHLVVSHFRQRTNAAAFPNPAPDPYDPYDATTTPFTIGWSHLDNPDEFFPTDINEADIYQLPSRGFSDTSVNGITGMGPLGDLLYIYTTDAAYRMRYVGLPTVMQIEPAWQVIGCRYADSLVVSPFGHYFIGENNFYFFDGTNLNTIGDAVKTKFFGELSSFKFSFYDQRRNEIVWTYSYGISTYRQVVYQERDKQWFFRNVPLIYSQGRMAYTTDRCVYGGDNQIYADVEPEAGSLVNTVPDNGAGYTEPSVTSHTTKFGGPRTVKEIDGVYLDASWRSGTCDGIEVALSRSNFVADLPSAFTAMIRKWTADLVEGILTFPKLPFKTIKQRLTFKGTKVVNAKLHEWADSGVSAEAEK